MIAEPVIQRLVDHLPVSYWVNRTLDIPVFMKWVRFPRNGRVLELGCGQGRLARYLAGRFQFKSYVAGDPDPKNIAAAVQSRRDQKISFQQVDLCHLPSEKGAFDTVISINALHSVPEWKKAIREIHRVLRPKGTWLLRDYSIETFCMPGFGWILQHFLEKPYDTMYDQVELVTHIRKNGFDITHQSDNVLGLLLAAVKK